MKHPFQVWKQFFLYSFFNVLNQFLILIWVSSYSDLSQFLIFFELVLIDL